MAKKDYYKLLCVTRQASEKEIKKAYKKLAKKYHPDFNQGDKNAEDQFKEISEAYQVLSNTEKRKQYDLFGHDGFQGTSGFNGWNQNNTGSQQYTSSSGGKGVNFDDIFSEIFGKAGQGNMRPGDFSTGSPFGFNDNFNRSSGRDMETEVTISFDDAIKGGLQRFSLQRAGLCGACKGLGRNRAGQVDTCASCNGKGRKQVGNMGTNFTVVCNTCNGEGHLYKEPCGICRGSGRTTELDHLGVKIPPGVDDGGRLRIPGKGGVGSDGRTGDLYVRIHVQPHKFFKRKKKDIHLDLPITISEAILGTKIEVPTLNGRKATLKIHSGTQNGAVLRMKKKGVPDPKGGTPGNMYVHIQVMIPKSVNGEAKRIIEDLGMIESNPRSNMYV